MPAKPVRPTPPAPVPGHPWLAHYPPHVAPTLPKIKGGLPQLLEESAVLYPWRTALIFMGEITDYGALWQQAQAFAHALLGLNLPPQSRIGLCLPNCPAYVVGFWGTLLAGHVVVNMNPLLTPEELAFELNDSGAALLLTFNLNPTLGKVQQAVRQSRTATIWLADLADDMPEPLATGFRLLNLAQRQRHLPYTGRHRWAWLSDILATATPHRLPRLNPAMLAVLQYTGGTTGTPKAAMLTHGSLLANTRQVQGWLGSPHPQGETMPAILPLFHVFALTSVLLMGTALASRIILMPQFTLPGLVRLINRHRPTLLMGVPTLFQALATHPAAKRARLGSLRFCISGGAPLPATVREAFAKRTEAALVEGYGLTEASPVLACGPSVGPLSQGSVGYPLPSTVVGIFNPKPPHNPVPLGEVGEIWAKGPQVMKGYWRNPLATRAVMHAGWLRTGDMGRLDETGALHVVDRLKDMVIVNGYKVYPRQVEEILLRHPAIHDAVVVAIPHPRTGEAPMAFVTLHAPYAETMQAHALKEWANARLNKLARLAALEIRETLPKTMVGKSARKELAAEARARMAPVAKPKLPFKNPLKRKPKIKP